MRRKSGKLGRYWCDRDDDDVALELDYYFNGLVLVCPEIFKV